MQCFFSWSRSQGQTHPHPEPLCIIASILPFESFLSPSLELSQAVPMLHVLRVLDHLEDSVQLQDQTPACATAAPCEPHRGKYAKAASTGTGARST
eukprot:s1864_g11.t1